MLDVIFWYLIISLVGWLSVPLAYWLLPALADRGYTLVRSLGWLLWGYLFWLLASLGILRNDTGSLLFALLLLVVLSGWVYRKIAPGDLLVWLRGRFKFVMVVELLFLLSYLGMVVIRAANPEILGTEKPMELAFINAILRSPTFPPHDPWLSGYAISYYYFGYVLVAMLAKLAGTPGSVAFNLGISLVFALSMTGVYGLVYNLLAARQLRTGGTDAKPSLSLPLLGPLFVIVAGNLEGILHVLHNRGLFWKTDATGALSSGFWTWLDIRELNLPPEGPFSWAPTKFWWWWRASRVVQDYDLAGNWREVIDEFPAFSYLLADLHPHVLAMPFAFLGMALALNVILGGAMGRTAWFQRRVNLRTLSWASVLLIVVGLALLWLGLSSLKLSSAALGAVSLFIGGVSMVGVSRSDGARGLSVFTRNDMGEKQVGLPINLHPIYLIAGAVILGGMAFLNTWDFPIYVALFAAAYVIMRYTREEVDPENPAIRFAEYSGGMALRDFLALCVVLVAGGFILYLPFYLSFSSQAGGVLPSLVYVTRGAHLWVMFGTLLLPMSVYLGYLWKSAGSRKVLRSSAFWVLGLVLAAFLSSLALGAAITLIPGVGEIFLGSFSAVSLSDLVLASISRRIVSPGAWITLVFLLVFILALLRQRRVDVIFHLTPSDRFALLLALFASALVFGVEFFFLRDQFGTRMNTIFKFYYQAWLMWGTVAAFGAAVLLRELSPRRGIVYSALLVVLLGMGLTYTLLAFWNKTEGFSPSQEWSLDGAAYLEIQSPDDMAAVRWLSAAPAGVVAEAVGGSYSSFARAATFSGQPNVLGWPGHESQWRGGAKEIGSREGDIQQLYCARDWEQARAMIDKYNIRYIFVGSLERSAYTPDRCIGGLNEDKFARNLNLAFQQGDTAIYEMP